MNTPFHIAFISRPLLALMFVLLCFSSIAQGNTPAGTVITNQATATFKDDNGVEYKVVSNVVKTLIEQVAGLDLTQDQIQQAAPGKTVYLPHRIVNTGNGDDQYALSVINESGDSGELLDLAIYTDTDQDGLPDNAIAIDATSLVSANEVFDIVVVGTVPSGAAINDLFKIGVFASSSFSPSIESKNVDEIIVERGAAIELQKSISSTTGDSPSGPYSVTLKFTNSGSELAENLTIIDALPSGMVYVPGSAKWNLTSQPLTDANADDGHIGGNAVMYYCAYDSSCTNLPESNLDQDSDSTNQVTAIISAVQVGETGSLTFDVEIAPDLSIGALTNQAEFEYESFGAVEPRALSNPVDFSVLERAGVVANGSRSTAIDGMSEPVTLQTSLANEYIYFENIIWNTGNVADRFNIEIDSNSSTFPLYTEYFLMSEDRVYGLNDSNFDGVVDTGLVQPGEYAVVVLRLYLPFGSSGDNNGLGYDVQLTARSDNNPSVFNTIIDHLDGVAGYAVDITNNAAAGSAPALGEGTGPESTPVVTAIVDDADQATFDLYVRQMSGAPGNYNLTAVSTANGAALPAGWEVVFTDGVSGFEISETNTLESGEAQHIIATVNAPATEFDVQDIYFRATSPVAFGSSDTVYNQVKFVRNPQIELSPDLNAQINAGGFTAYSHVVSNAGNVVLNDIIFEVQNSNDDWQSVLYADTDMNGFLSPDDEIIENPMSLQRGESADVFLKVFTAATAAQGQNNISTLTAKSSLEGIESVVTDVSTVNLSQISILKEQAVDNGCDGQPDTGNAFTRNEINVAPGNNCVIYRLTATNNGTQATYNVVIRDYTPPYTVYYPSAVCSRTPCWINEPSIDETGTINAETDELPAGDAYSLQFSVRVQ